MGRGGDDEGLGSALAAPDVDGDGAAELLVGASEARDIGRSSGAAYLLYGPLSGTLESADAPLRLVGEARRDAAGSGVGFADLLGEGVDAVLVGAPGESSGAESSGALYAISL